MGGDSCNSRAKNGTRQIGMIGTGNSSAIRQCCVVGDNFKSSTDHCSDKHNLIFQQPRSHFRILGARMPT